MFDMLILKKVPIFSNNLNNGIKRFYVVCIKDLEVCCL